MKNTTRTPHDEAQVLFTTQQMLMKHLNGRPFTQCSAFHFLGSPRQVRVWDETLEPGEVLALSTDDLGGMLPSLRRFSSDCADQVQSLQAHLAEAKPGSLLKVPEVPETVLSHASACLPEGGAKATIDRLRAMLGQTARVFRGIGNQRITLVVRDSLPADLAPILVLDASGRIRETYKLWEGHRGGLVHLRSATKDYSPLSFHLMDQGGGKGSWQCNGEHLAKEAAEVINRNPGVRWLVIHYKPSFFCDPEKLIRAQLSKDATQVEFVHWGAHQATNRFKDVENIILAGTLFLPEGDLAVRCRPRGDLHHGQIGVTYLSA